MLTDYWIYIVLALAVIIPLAVYAGSLLSKLKAQTQQQAAAEKAKKDAHKVHDTKVLTSVVIIARAMKAEQCDVAEGCWRLSVLLDSLKLSSELEAQFSSVYQLYNAIKHMPILEERKKLEKKERMKLDFERMKIESELAPKIKEDVEQIHQYATERLSVISPGSENINHVIA